MYNRTGGIYYAYKVPTLMKNIYSAMHAWVGHSHSHFIENFPLKEFTRLYFAQSKTWPLALSIFALLCFFLRVFWSFFFFSLSASRPASQVARLYSFSLNQWYNVHNKRNEINSKTILSRAFAQHSLQLNSYFSHSRCLSESAGMPHNPTSRKISMEKSSNIILSLSYL